MVINMDGMIKINGALLPNPVRMDIVCKDVESNSVYSESGTRHRNIVRKNVYRIDVCWKLSEADFGGTLSNIDGDSVSVSFLDPETGAFITKEMYCPERNFSCIGFENGNGWWTLTLSLYEY